MTPAVSVIIPMYNAGPFIGEALASVAQQTVSLTEVIVVDDGSTDEGPEIVRAMPGVKLLECRHRGIGATLNEGLAQVRGEYLAFLDADDRWRSKKTELQLAAFAREPALSMVFGHAQRFRMVGERAGTQEQVLDVIPGLARPSGLFRRTDFMRVGAFDAKSASEFLDWYSRAQDAGLRSVMLPDVVFERRLHASNFGITNQGAERNSYFVALKATLDRRRRDPGSAPPMAL